MPTDPAARRQYAQQLLDEGTDPGSITTPWLREEMMRLKEGSALGDFNLLQDSFDEKGTRPEAKKRGDRAANRKRLADLV